MEVGCDIADEKDGLPPEVLMSTVDESCNGTISATGESDIESRLAGVGDAVSDFAGEGEVTIPIVSIETFPTNDLSAGRK